MRVSNSTVSSILNYAAGQEQSPINHYLCAHNKLQIDRNCSAYIERSSSQGYCAYARTPTSSKQLLSSRLSTFLHVVFRLVVSGEVYDRCISSRTSTFNMRSDCLVPHLFTSLHSPKMHLLCNLPSFHDSLIFLHFTDIARKSQFLRSLAAILYEVVFQ